MKTLELNDDEAKVLEEILTTVQEVYDILGHSEWANGDYPDGESDKRADEAIKIILKQLKTVG